MDKRKKILVTGIGGNVGQGIIRNIRKNFPLIHITGINVTSFSAGNHLCDAFYLVPFANSDTYIIALIDICTIEKIALIIPSTDYEVYFLSVNRFRISSAIAVSGGLASELYLDKYLPFSIIRNIIFHLLPLPCPQNIKGNLLLVLPNHERAEGPGDCI